MLLLSIGDNVQIASTIFGIVSALSAIILGWFKWGREDVNNTANTAKSLVEAMREVNAEIKAQKVELQQERDQLEHRVEELELALRVERGES